MTFLINKKKDSSSRITIEIPKSIIQKKLSQEILYINNNTNINGFRKGKIPFKIIQEKYGEKIYYDVFNKLMQKYFYNFIKEKKIKIIGNPKYYVDDDFKKNQENFKYSVIYEKYPKFHLKNINNIKVQKIVVSITKQDIKKYLTEKQQNTYKWKLVNRPINIHDKVTIDYSVYLNNKKQEEFNTKNFSLIMLKNNCIPQLYNQIINKRKKDMFFCKINFSKYHPEKKLQNNSVILKVQIQEIQTKEIIEKTIDKKENLCNLPKEEYINIKENIKNQINKISDNYLYNQIIENLIKENPINIPYSLLQTEIDYLYNQQKAKYQEKKDNILTFKYHKNIKKIAIKNIHIKLIVQKIIINQKFSPNIKNMQALINNAAKNAKKPLEFIQLYNTNKKLMEYIKSIELETQVMNFLFNTVKIIKKNCILNDILNNSLY